MRTNIELDDDVLREAQRALGTPTTRATVHAALLEVVAQRRRLELRELRGTLRWAGDLDQSRTGRT